MRNFLLASLSFAVLSLAASASWLLLVTAQTERSLPALIDTRVQAIQDRLMADIDLHAGVVESMVIGRTGDVLAIANGAVQRADARTAEAEADVVRIADHADSQITGIRTDINGQMVSLSGIIRDAVQPVDDLARRYTLIPDQLATVMAPSWAATEPEITCRHADGSGYGGCWHSRITGLMGEAVNIGGVFTQHFPALSTSITGIAVDAHTFTSRAVAPRGFWGNFKDIVGTSSGLVRAGAAAGVF